MTSKTAEITQSKCSVKNQQYVQWCKNVDSKTVIKTNSKALSENLSELTLIQKFVYAFEYLRHTKMAMSRTQCKWHGKTVKMCTQW